MPPKKNKKKTEDEEFDLKIDSKSKWTHLI